MYLTNEKRLNLKINGSFYTRKWNEFVDCVYFEKILGGKSLLKNMNKQSKELKLSFNSSMISQGETKKWLESGWFEKHSLLVCESNLKNIKKTNQNKHKSIEHKRFNLSDIESLLKIDDNIFDPYWKNSYSNFIETMKSCNNNYLFKIFSENKLRGYAILGETRGFTYLQRFGIDKIFQNQGLGKELLHYILLFAESKNYKKMKLNTQENNEAALSLYTNNSFSVSKTKLMIMSSSVQNEV
jgi:ribosomal protein S18 acetylase RimI-like enzyme